MYKKLLLVFVSAITIQSVKAQTEKGSQMLGASFGVSTSKGTFSFFDPTTGAYINSDDSKFTTYSISPSYSYFIADKLDFGAALGYSHLKQQSSNNLFDSQNQNSNSYFGTLYLRKYFLYENKIGIRTGPYLSYQRTNQNQTFGSVSGADSRTNSYGGGVGLDFVYFPVKRIGLSALLGNLNYSHQKISGTTKGTANSFNLSFANSLALSVNYIFGN